VDSDSEVGGMLRQNWALFVAMGALLGGAAFVYMFQGSESPAASANVASVSAGQPGVVIVPGTNQPRAVRKTTQELALEQIAEHEAKVEADPDHEDTPAYLMAMGNLYRQKMVDYEKAAECYELLLVDHSDWDGVRVAYMQLATCYERLDQPELAKVVYEKMLKVFPSDSQEHEIAYAAVYR